MGKLEEAKKIADVKYKNLWEREKRFVELYKKAAGVSGIKTKKRLYISVFCETIS